MRPKNCTQLANPGCDGDCEGCGFDAKEYWRRLAMIRDHQMVPRDGKYILILGGTHEQSNPDGAARKRP